jgi:hypothetical protein
LASLCLRACGCCFRWRFSRPLDAHRCCSVWGTCRRMCPRYCLPVPPFLFR